MLSLLLLLLRLLLQLINGNECFLVNVKIFKVCVHVTISYVWRKAFSLSCPKFGKKATALYIFFWESWLITKEAQKESSWNFPWPQNWQNYHSSCFGVLPSKHLNKDISVILAKMIENMWNFSPHQINNNRATSFDNWKHELFLHSNKWTWEWK